MMCADWEPLIERYHDQELPEAQRARVVAHLESCAACRKQLEALEQVGETLALQGQLVADAVDLSSLWPSIAQRLPEARPPRLQERLGEWLSAFWGANRRMVAAGALGACAALLVAVPLLRGGSPDAPGGAGAVPATVAVNEVIVDSLQSGEHDMVLVNVHPDDMTTVIWLLEDGDGDEPGPGSDAPGGAVGVGPVPEPAPVAAPDAGGPGPAVDAAKGQ